MTTMVRNIGGLLSGSQQAMAPSTTETEVNGAYISRVSRTLHPSGPALSCRVILNYSALLIPSGTLTALGNVQDATSTDGTGVADYRAALDFLPSTVITNTSTGDVTFTGVHEYDVNLSAAREAIRTQQTLTASGTGTVNYSATIVFGPSRELPS